MPGVKDLRNLDDETRSELLHLFIGSAGFRHRQLGFGLEKLHEDPSPPHQIHPVSSVFEYSYEGSGGYM
jgi:hypothetical protein